MFPPSTNGDYKGSTFSWQVLLVIATLLLLSGLSNALSPELAAATPDLRTTHGRDVVHLLGVQAAFQLTLAMVYMLVVVRYRSFVPLALLAESLHQVLIQLVYWILAPAQSNVEQEPLVLQLLFVGMSLAVFVAFLLSSPRRAGQGEQPQAP